MRLRNPPVFAAEHFAREQNLSPVLIPTLSKDMDEQLKLAHKLVDLVDGTKWNTCVTLMRSSVDKPKSSYAQLNLFAKKKENEKFQQIIYVNYKLEELIYLLDGINSVYDNIIVKKMHLYYPEKSNCTFLLCIIFFYSIQGELGHSR